MKIKVCGMTDRSNIGELVKLSPDYIGFIFYPKSKRFIGTSVPDEILGLIPDAIQKAGVFVDEPFDSLVEKFNGSKLDIVQLHGTEDQDYCQKLKNLNIPVIKVFSITPDFDFAAVKPFEHCCDYFLFDTAGDLRGGSGIKFDWEKLNGYRGNRPFFLSGGIQPTDINAINNILHTKLHGVDLNSGFEIEPGIKNIAKLRLFLEAIRR